MTWFANDFSSHTYKGTREKDSCAGCILDVDTTPLSDNQFWRAKSTLSSLQLNRTVELTFREAMLICFADFYCTTFYA
jgi:hypothetical protein